ncbi:diflavin flavoprotein [Thermosynechococcaceae cyanobacterium BACA0444]|uniref:Diflavin flavoprotein n=1 Tax=Pseudocalidococcus azoricus BACA0444 TaxID=2918990 RepID=A0AAE4FSY2_9CYAN|nr:diflavin flavoprotein [Pseudocalidococcus azoricus]MDS3860391.1 diflavin flavoprotein [Pseudocalidococcus azoricus BACA0444]
MTLTQTRPRDVQVTEIGTNTIVLRSRTWERLKFEIEYGRQQGTTSNSYLIQTEQSALIDPPGESFTELYLAELVQHIYLQKLNYIVLGHLNSNRLTTLKTLQHLAPQAIFVCSKPGAITLKAALGTDVNVWVPRNDAVLDLGQDHQLQFIFAPTPRWPDGLLTYDPVTRILYTDKFFGTHVCGDAVYDEAWKKLDQDRRYYFDCLHAAQSRQVETALDKIATLTPKMYAPAHGPLVRFSLSRLNHDYRQWSQEQKEQDTTVALLYASAYGNTAIMAQALAKGLSDAGIKVESINCEATPPNEIQTIVSEADGFLIGSPTLGGHMPTQVQTALGLVLSHAAKTKLAGVFGSYGWSGEAVDEIESKLQDAGYALGFETLRVKFTPTEQDLLACEAAGTEFAQALKKARKSRTVRQPVLLDVQADRTEQAVGRVVGSLCVLTTPSSDLEDLTQAESVLVSWVSQASFNPPGLTVALRRDWAENTCQIGDVFVLNILKEGLNIRRSFQQPLKPGATPLTELRLTAASNGCPVITDALAYLECQVESRLECGDHWLVYAVVQAGHLLEDNGLTAIQHRKSGQQY